MYLRFLACLLLLTLPFASEAQQMNNDNLEKILYVMIDTIIGEGGAWQFAIKDVPMMCITDETNNRMRIISPIKKMEEVTDEEKESVLAANFHSALDVRYAVADDIMSVAFIHPLKELTKNQVIDAVSQVYNATLTYGSTYSSTDLVFPKSEEDEKKEKRRRGQRN